MSTDVSGLDGAFGVNKTIQYFSTNLGTYTNIYMIKIKYFKINSNETITINAKTVGGTNKGIKFTKFSIKCGCIS
jgi:hypothetical protein